MWTDINFNYQYWNTDDPITIEQVQYELTQAAYNYCYSHTYLNLMSSAAERYTSIYSHNMAKLSIHFQEIPLTLTDVLKFIPKIFEALKQLPVFRNIKNKNERWKPDNAWWEAQEYWFSMIISVTLENKTKHG